MSLYQTTYKELKQCRIIHGEGEIVCYQTTYKELKRTMAPAGSRCIPCYQTTYKELKHLTAVLDEVVALMLSDYL